MELKITETFGKTLSNEVSKFEKIINGKLPDYYKNFILKNNGGRPVPNIFSTLNGEYETDIQFFFGFGAGVYNLRNNHLNFQIELTKNFIAIAIDSIGSLILLNIDSGEVYYFDHEIEEIFLISNSFKEFISNLYELDEDESELDIAVSSQNILYFKNLISENIDINDIVDEFDQSIAVVAALANKLKLLKFFIENGAKIDGVLFNACSNGHLEIVKFLLKIGANPNERDPEQNNDTALIQASFGGHLEIVKLLIAKGADINATDNFDQSALTKSYWSNNEELIKYFEKEIYKI